VLSPGEKGVSIGIGKLALPIDGKTSYPGMFSDTTSAFVTSQFNLTVQPPHAGFGVPTKVLITGAPPLNVVL